MTNVAQRFNVDLMFLYGSTIYSTYGNIGSHEKDERSNERRAKTVFIIDGTYYDFRYPDFYNKRTDWSRRAIELPAISKSMEPWTGQFQTSEVGFALADTDGSVYGSLYGNGRSPVGGVVGIFSRVSENPTYWYPVFAGNIVRTERNRGKISLSLEDGFRNLFNSAFVHDYAGIATLIDGKLYGTIKDVIGTNVYLDDRGDKYLRRSEDDDGGDWFGKVFGALLTVGIGAISGGIPGAALGAISGGLSALGGGRQPTTQYWYEVQDYNAIPDGVIFGGQRLKFLSGSVSARANRSLGPLYEVDSIRVRGGRFVEGIYGTIEVDDQLNTINKGDYVYSELPLVYSGSPDDIIINLLTGSNVTVNYTYPDDFSANWVSQTAPLKHIEAFRAIGDNDTVLGVITSLCTDYGFSFYLDENNRFSVRSLREQEHFQPETVGTISEDFNILNEGVTMVEDIRDTYTSLDLKYQPFFDGGYTQTFTRNLPTSTYYGGAPRVKSISSEWIHDQVTAEFQAARFARKWGTAFRKIECELSLYSVPIALGEVLSVTSQVTGTGAKYEITSYEKDFGRSVARVGAEDISYMYGQRGFAYFKEGTFSGFATVISYHYQGGGYGALAGSVDTEQTAIYLTDDVWSGYRVSDLTGWLIRIGNSEEIMRVVSVEGVHIPNFHGNTVFSVLKVDRGHFNTIPTEYPPGLRPVQCMAPYATYFGINPSQGTSFFWF